MQTNLEDPKNATLENISQVGNTRRQELRGAGYNNVGDVASADATELFEQTSGMSASAVETIVTNARDLVGDEEEAEVEVSADGTPAKYVPDEPDDGPDNGATVEADDFLDSIDDTSEDVTPDECENVAIIAGDDAFDATGPYGDLDAEGQAGLVASKLTEFGFEPETVTTVSSGMGAQAVKSWVSYSRNEGISIPDLAQPFEADFDEHDSAGDAFQARNEELLEWADGICVVANGDYVGMWVTMSNDYDTIIRTPMMNDDSDDE